MRKSIEIATSLILPALPEFDYKVWNAFSPGFSFQILDSIFFISEYCLDDQHEYTSRQSSAKPHSLYIFKSSRPFLKLKIQLYYSKMLIVLTSVIIEVLLTAKYDTVLTLREPTWKFQTSIRP